MSLIESGKELPVVAAGPDAYTFAGSTTNFDVYYDSSLGAVGQTLANAILASCEADLAALVQLFGVASPARFATYINPGTGGAFHVGCLDTDLQCSSWPGDGGLEIFLNCAEVDEVMMAAQAAGWNCSASAGEGLSRVLALNRLRLRWAIRQPISMLLKERTTRFTGRPTVICTSSGGAS